MLVNDNHKMNKIVCLFKTLRFFIHLYFVCFKSYNFKVLVINYKILFYFFK